MVQNIVSNLVPHYYVSKQYSRTHPNEASLRLGGVVMLSARSKVALQKRKMICVWYAPCKSTAIVLVFSGGVVDKTHASF